MGASFLGGYIGYDKSKGSWLKKKTEKWEKDICAITKTAEKYPKESYAMEVRMIQSEEMFLQPVTNDTVQAFTGLEKFSGKPFFKG